MRQQHLVLLALILCFALLATLAFCSTEDRTPIQMPSLPPQQHQAG
jgi:hypothetical protein